MGWFSYSQIDRDFAGGIYLAPLGKRPPLEWIEEVAYEGDLYLPLSVGGRTMEVTAVEGEQVAYGSLLAWGGGYYLYAPRAGRIGQVKIRRAAGKVLTLHPAQEGPPAHLKDTLIPDGPTSQAITITPGAGEMTRQRREVVWHKLERAGIVSADTAGLLAQSLLRWQREDIALVVANATPLEPTLNGSLAILHHWPDEVFAGLSILQTWLGAEEAIMAYPHNFAIDRGGAAIWQVRCVPVSEKYPQGRAGSLLKTLDKQGQLPRFRRRKRRAVVFEIQLLYQVGQAVLTGKLPTERIVTINGDGVNRPSHFRVPLGVPLGELLRRAEMQEKADCVAAGSSLAGQAIEVSQAVVGLTSDAYTVVAKVPRYRSYNCIRCGWCIDDCPAEIDPARLLELAQLGQYALARQWGVDLCIECGICSYICPAHLRIMEHIRLIKYKLHPEPTPAARRDA